MGWQEVNTSFSRKIRHVSPIWHHMLHPKAENLKDHKSWAIDKQKMIHRFFIVLTHTSAVYQSHVSLDKIIDCQ